MQLPENGFKRGLRERRVQYGLWSSLGSSYAAEIVAGAGFDWILVDLEHAPTSVESLLPQLQAIAGYPPHVLVRLPSQDSVTIKRVLDTGVQTLLVPHVASAEEARRAVAATRYPPAGVRGLGGTTRATRFGRIHDYAERADKEICVIAMVESRSGLDALEAICAVEGIDGVFLGPGDLSAALGKPGLTRDPEVLQAIEAAIGRIAKTGRASGYMSTVEEDVRRMAAAGALFCGVGMDAALLARSTEALSKRYHP